MFQPCLFKNKSVVIYEVQEKFPSYTKPLLAADQGQGWFDSDSAPAGKGRSGPPSAEGSVLLPFRLLGKPHVPLPLSPPGSSRSSPASLDVGARAGPGRGAQNTWGCPGKAAAPGAPRGCHSLLHSQKPRRRSVLAPPSSSPSSPRKTDGEHPGCPEGAFPVPERLCPCPGLALGLSSAAPALGRGAQPGVLQLLPE